MTTTSVIEQTTRELSYVPCLKCGSTEVKFFDFGYTQGNSGGGKCVSCGNECISPMHWNAKKDQWVAAWNAMNDPAKLIEAQHKIIQAAQDRIQEISARRVAMAEQQIGNGLGKLFEVDLDEVLKERFQAGKGVVQLLADMPDAATLSTIQCAAKFGKPFMVIPPAKV